ncbi:MAG: hypothetical protein JW913_17250 [Chitinispirillaceae bacterium]|nr:hypothetical protein [Chitinispirillaceae bacterium]
MRMLIMLVTVFLFSSIELNCVNPASSESTVDTLCINSSDTLYRLDTVYDETLLVSSSDTVYRFDTVTSRDTVYVETLLAEPASYICIWACRHLLPPDLPIHPERSGFTSRQRFPSGKMALIDDTSADQLRS